MDKDNSISIPQTLTFKHAPTLDIEMVSSDHDTLEDTKYICPKIGDIINPVIISCKTLDYLEKEIEKLANRNAILEDRLKLMCKHPRDCLTDHIGTDDRNCSFCGTTFKIERGG